MKEIGILIPDQQQEQTNLAQPQVIGQREMVNGKICIVYHNPKPVINEVLLEDARAKSQYKPYYPSFEERGGWVEYQQGKTIYHNPLPEAYQKQESSGLAAD